MAIEGHIFSGAIVTDGTLEDGARYINELNDLVTAETGAKVSLVKEQTGTNVNGGKGIVASYEARSWVRIATFDIIVADNTVDADTVPWSQGILDPGRVRITLNVTSTYTQQNRIFGVRVTKPNTPGVGLAMWYAKHLEEWGRQRSENFIQGWGAY